MALFAFRFGAGAAGGLGGPVFVSGGFVHPCVLHRRIPTSGGICAPEIGSWRITRSRCTDPFSSYGMGKPWIAYSWLFDVISASAFARLGLVSIVLWEIAARVALSVALFHLVRGLCPGFWRAVALTAAGLWVMTEVIGPRPGMLTILFVILEFDILLSCWQDRARTKTLWLLPPMFALWANWHIQFVYGLFVLGVFACEPLLNRLTGWLTGYTAREKSSLPAKQTWLVLAASALATLLNPYGAKIYSTVFVYMRETGAYDAISELRAMTFREPQHFVVLLLALGAAMAIGWRRDARPLWLVFLVVTSMHGLSVGARGVVPGDCRGVGDCRGMESRERETSRFPAAAAAAGRGGMRSGGPGGDVHALRRVQQLAGTASGGQLSRGRFALRRTASPARSSSERSQLGRISDLAAAAIARGDRRPDRRARGRSHTGIFRPMDGQAQAGLPIPSWSGPIW